MSILKPPLAWAKHVGRQFAPQNEQERQRDRIVAVFLALIATLALLYQFLT